MTGLAGLMLVAASVASTAYSGAATAAPAAMAGTASDKARCTRDIAVPLSSSGVSVIIDGGIKGIYPELLHSVGARQHCHFAFSAVPRARQVAMFQAGQADLLLPASRTPARDKLGTFVPMISHRAMLVSIAGNRPAIASAQDLLARRELRVAVVRGFDYGEQYTALIKELGRQGRLYVEVDVLAVARLLHAGSADVSIMGPTLMAAAIQGDTRVRGLQERLRFDAIPELPWSDSGAYISRLSLKPEDQKLLRELLERAAKTNAVMDGYLRYFRPEVLADNVRPR